LSRVGNPADRQRRPLTGIFVPTIAGAQDSTMLGSLHPERAPKKNRNDNPKQQSVCFPVPETVVYGTRGPIAAGLSIRNALRGVRSVWHG
jgi:hypothetical protein